MIGLLATRSAISKFDSREEVLARVKDALYAVKLSIAGSDPAMQMRAHTFVTVLSYLLGNFLEAKSSEAELIDVSLRFGIPSYGTPGLIFGALANMATGKWESIAETCEFLEEASIYSPATVLRMSVDAFLDFDVEYEETTTRALGEFLNSPTGTRIWIWSAIAQVQLMHPDLTLTQDLWEQIDTRSGTDRGSFTRLARQIGFDAIRAVLDQDSGAARAAYEETRRMKGLYWILSFDRLLGLLSRVMGELD
jgi:hypothetical protein